MVKLDKVNKTYGDTHALIDASLKVSKGEVLVIIGKSGAGKSTLLRCINMLAVPDSGSVFINDKRVNETNVVNIRQKVGMVFQSYNLFDHLTVMENLTIAPIKLLRMNKSAAQEQARELLRTVGLEGKENAIPSELSGGQKQRVAIARVLAMSPDVILFDEPTSALDPVMTNEVLSIIYKLAQNGMTMLIVTHEMNFAKAVATKVVYMENGEIIEQGEPKQIFINPEDYRTKNFVDFELDYFQKFL